MQTTLIVASLLFSLVSAQYFYITNPVQNSIFKAGATEPITWSNGINETASVTLLTGSNALTMTSTDVSFSIDGASGVYDWTVPTNLPQNGTYSLQIIYSINSTTMYSYSSSFSITGTSTSSSVSQIATAVVGTSSTTLPSSSSAAVSSVAVPSSTVSPLTSSVSVSSAAAVSTSSIALSATSLIASTTPTPFVSIAIAKTPTFAITGLLVLGASFLI